MASLASVPKIITMANWELWDVPVGDDNFRFVRVQVLCELTQP